MLVLIVMLLSNGCYDDYRRPYDYDAIYTAYQYDLRTFVMGENQSFDFTVALGGVASNQRDRYVSVTLANYLLDVDLSAFSTEVGIDSFTALDAFLGNAGIGYVSQPYVGEQVRAAGITSLIPLPESFYTIEGLENMTIKKGRHTAVATIKATDSIMEDSHALAPYYALGFKINSADSDMIIPEMSFEIIAVKCENKHFGYWYYEGEKSIVDELTSEVISTDRYTADINQPDERSCYLTTVGFNTISTNKSGGEDNSLLLAIAPDNTITITDLSGSKSIEMIDGKPSYTNNALLLQDRKIYLNYRYSNGDGTMTVVSDILKFKYRIRDGVLEYQDENPEHYEK